MSPEDDAYREAQEWLASAWQAGMVALAAERVDAAHTSLAELLRRYGEEQKRLTFVSCAKAHEEEHGDWQDCSCTIAILLRANAVISR